MGLLFNKNFAKGPTKFGDLDPVYRAQAVVAVGNCCLWQELDELLIEEGSTSTAAKELVETAISKNFAMLFGFAQHHNLDTVNLFSEVVDHINNAKNQPRKGAEEDNG